MAMDDIKSLREKIIKVDEDIIDLLAKRLKLAKKVGEYKWKNRLPIKNFQVEK